MDRLISQTILDEKKVLFYTSYLILYKQSANTTFFKTLYIVYND